MSGLNYTDKLASPKWQRRRLEIMQRDNFSCVRCGSTTKTLNVHHKVYLHRREVYQYEDEHLETLCFECHRKEHFEKPITPAKVWEGIEERKLSTTQQKILDLQMKLQEPISEEKQFEILEHIMRLRKEEKSA